MEKIINLLIEKENILLFMSCAASICGVIISLVTVRKTIKDQMIIKKNIRKKYIQLYKRRYNSSSEEIINQQLILRLSELDDLIEKIKNKEEINYSKEQKEHLRNVMMAIEKINLSTRDLEQPSKLGQLRYLEKVTKNIAKSH